MFGPLPKMMFSGTKRLLHPILKPWYVIEKFQLQKTIEDMAEFSDKVAFKIDGNDSFFNDESLWGT
jgi:hypothetical protein